jgi:hypothetical protein
MNANEIPAYEARLTEKLRRISWTPLLHAIIREGLPHLR